MSFHPSNKQWTQINEVLSAMGSGGIHGFLNKCFWGLEGKDWDVEAVIVSPMVFAAWSEVGIGHPMQRTDFFDSGDWIKIWGAEIILSDNAKEMVVVCTRTFNLADKHIKHVYEKTHPVKGRFHVHRLDQGFDKACLPEVNMVESSSREDLISKVLEAVTGQTGARSNL